MDVLLASGLPPLVGDSEDLARFLTSSSQFNVAMVKPVAFMPNPKDNHRTSVIRHGQDPRSELWRIAREFVVGDRRLLGAAIIDARTVRNSSLDVIADEPPPRHANIVGWATDEADREAEKARQKEQALLLAQHARLIRY
jgi:hypothetical protein